MTDILKEELASAQTMLATIARVQTDFLNADPASSQGFETLLNAMLDLTGSAYGFIGEIFLDDEGQRYLKARAITNIAWDRETKALYERSRTTGMEFRNLDTLFGAVLRSGEVLIANEAADHAAAGGLPPGHPALDAFLGIPLHSGEEFIGMLGLANRPNGYSQALVAECRPILLTIANLIRAHRLASEHKRAERHLTDTNARLLQALDLSQTGCWDVNLATGEVYWDDRTCTIHDLEPGYRPTLENAINFYAPGSRDIISAAVQETIETGIPYNIELELLTAKGRQIWVQTAGRLVRENGKGVRLSGVFRDVDAQKRREIELEAALAEAALHQQAEVMARAALRESEYRLKSATEAGQLGIWTFRPLAGETEYSARCMEMLGYPAAPTTLNARELSALIHPDDRKRMFDAIDEHLAGLSDRYTFDCRVKCGDGQYKWINSYGQVIERDASGRATRASGISQDISERKALETELGLASQRLRVAVEAAGLGIWDLDLTTNQLSWDATMAEMYGIALPDGPLAYSDWVAALHPDDRERAEAEAKAALESHEFLSSTFRILTPAGVERTIRGSAIVYETAPGKFRATGVNQDITAEVRRREELEARRREADAANEAKSQFLANMSHEIRTPLNGVLGMAQLLSLGELSPQQRFYTDTIRSSGRALLGLIEDVLDISRIESGQLELTYEPFSLNEMIKTALDTVRATAAEKSLLLESHCASDLPEQVTGDLKRTRQVLINLLGNAVKFTETGAVTLEVRAAANNRLRFEVIDTGPGVSDDQKSRIFGRFAQADGSTTRRHGGAGLGLAISREIVVRAGGEIGVTSTPGGGACFWFELPLTPPEHAAGEAAEPRQSVCRDAHNNGYTVLVAEDNRVNRAVATATLAGAGYTVIEVSDGAAALRALATESVDAVLMDVHMPVMPGDEAIRRIRAGEVPGREGIPILALTANATKGAQESLLALGANGYFAKPLDVGALLDGLARQIDASARRKVGT